MKIVIVGLTIDGREWLKSRIESGHEKCKVTVALVSKIVEASGSRIW